MKLQKPDWRRFADNSRRAGGRFIAEMRAPEFRAIGNLAVPAVLLTLFFNATRHLDWITQHFSLRWLFATVLVASFGLFYVRRFCRLGYGMLEIILGSVVVFDTIFASAPGPGPENEPVIKIAAGMYLTIRGIDNCMHWLTPKLGGAPAWMRWLFRSE